MTKTITALFDTRAEADEAAQALFDNGFPDSGISLLMSDATQGVEFAVTPGTKAAEGIAAGGITGGALGAVAAGLTAVGSITIPGLGLVAAGPVIAALAGGAAGAVAGGTIGGMVGLGIPEHEAKLYEQHIRKGGILLGVEAGKAQADLAARILRDGGGKHIHKS